MQYLRIILLSNTCQKIVGCKSDAADLFFLLFFDFYVLQKVIKVKTESTLCTISGLYEILLRLYSTLVFGKLNRKTEYNHQQSSLFITLQKLFTGLRSAS